MIKKKITYINENGFEFKFEPIEDTLIIKKTKLGFEAKYLIYDESPDNPFNTEYMEGNGIFYHWRDCGKEELQKYCEARGLDIETTEKISMGNPDCVLIDKYEHSGISYSVSGEGRQCRFDTSSGWAVWLPDNVLLDELKSLKGKERHKKCIEYAKQACELMNHYLNGDIYCIVKETYDKNKKQLNYDLNSNCYGRESAEQDLKNY